MKTQDIRFKDASAYAFEKIFPGILLPVERLLESARREEDSRSRSSLLAAACVLIFEGIKNITKFYSSGADTRDDCENFIQSFFPSFYLWPFKKLYRAYAQGRLNALTQEPLSSQSLIFETHPDGPVFSSSAEGALKVNVFKFREDFVSAVKKFREALEREADAEDRICFYHYYEKVKNAGL